MAIGLIAKTNRSISMDGRPENWRLRSLNGILSPEHHETGCLVGLRNTAARLSQPRIPVEGASGGPKVCIFGPSVSVFDDFAPLVVALRDRYERFDFVLMAEHPDTRARLQERFPFAAVLAPPGGLQRRSASFIKRLKIKCLIALNGLEHLDRAFIAALRRRAVSIVVVGMPDGGIRSKAAKGILMRHERHLQVDQFIVSEAAMAERLRAAGVVAEKIQVVEGLAGSDGIHPQAIPRVVEILKPFLAQHASLVRSQRQRGGLRLDAAIAWTMESKVVRRLLSSRVRRLETIEDLRRALGEPRTILCLGNGPSSEDRALGELAHDSLFRVNHRWLERGFLVEPDMVFTGSDKTLAAVHGTMFGLSSTAIETMLLRKWLLRRPFRRLIYFSPERAGVLSVDPARASQPTNGVIMLATAVALQPDRLTVAGIDLFQDPKGAYPGDPTTPNAYAAAHERSMELSWILEILGRYRGELVIVGDVLRRHWEDSRRGRLASK